MTLAQLAIKKFPPTSYSTTENIFYVTRL